MSISDKPIVVRLAPSGPDVFTTAADGDKVQVEIGHGMVLRMVEAASSTITQVVQVAPAPLANTSGQVFTVEMPNCDPNKLYQCQLQSNIYNGGTTVGDLVQLQVDIEASNDAGVNWYRVARNRIDSQENSARTLIAKFPLAPFPATFPLVKGETVRLRAQVSLFSGTATTTSFETHGEPGGCVFTLTECQP